jgi:hypothetical protein
VARGADDAGKFPHLPFNMQKLVKSIGFPRFEGMDSDEQDVYDRARNGYCMTCGGVLGKDANVIVNRYGIVAAYCSGVCHSDMAVMGFLQEQHDDISTAISMRGKGIPQADEIPNTLGEDPAFDEHEGENGQDDADS